LGDADRVAVCFGELTQARRAVENGAPVSRGELGVMVVTFQGGPPKRHG
jgi:hypothetical protein